MSNRPTRGASAARPRRRTASTQTTHPSGDQRRDPDRGRSRRPGAPGRPRRPRCRGRRAHPRRSTPRASRRATANTGAPTPMATPALAADEREPRAAGRQAGPEQRQTGQARCRLAEELPALVRGAGSRRVDSATTGDGDDAARTSTAASRAPRRTARIVASRCPVGSGSPTRVVGRRRRRPASTRSSDAGRPLR